MTKCAKGLFILCMPYLLSGCMKATSCVPDHSDGMWESIGAEPPSMSVIKEKLVGENGKTTKKIMNSHFADSKKSKDGTIEKTWVFEQRRKSVLRDCIRQDDVKITQSFLVVRANFINGVVSGCSIQNRMRVGAQPISIEEMLASPKGPLDSEPEPCEQQSRLD